jgi:glutamate dehydrogenase (NAD(P)+)
MAWMMDTISMHAGHSVPAVVTGKPLEIGGSEGRAEATGRGVMFTTLDACRRLGIDPRRATVVVQGAGNVGYTSAKLLAEAGCRVIAISDSSGGVYNANGIDLAAVAHEKERSGAINGKGGEPITNAELLELPCTILVPAALEGQITARNAPRIKAQIVAEGANGPTTPDADEILRERNITVIPDILANAGGVTVSYFEWVQDLQEFFWEESEINNRLEQILRKAYQQVAAISEERKITLRQAAYCVAVARVARATTVRGIYP